MGFEVERDWTTKAGYRAVAGIVTQEGLFWGVPEGQSQQSHRCGYVQVPTSHPLYGVAYSVPHDSLAGKLTEETKIGKRGAIELMLLAMSGGVGGARAMTPSAVFDVHGSITYSGDINNEPGTWCFGFDCSHCDDGYITPIFGYVGGGPVRSLEYVVEECESLARQLKEVVDGFHS